MTSSPPQHPIDQITERVDLLLQRYAQLQRTNGLLSEQVYALTQERASLTQERDSLKSRLQAARARVDALIERLPPPPKDDAP